MTDQQRLMAYVDVWWEAIESLTALLDQVPDEQWSTPTDLRGWDVRACASHVAHLESVLAGRPDESADVGDVAHARGPMGLYTEIGVVTRRDHSPQQIIAEIREVSALRRALLRADPPVDGSATPELTVAGAPWSWETLLRNRPLDVWMHEQDVRRAIGRPGGLDTGPARHTIDYLMAGFGYVVAKVVAAPPGTVAVLDVEGQDPVVVGVGDDGRGRRLEGVPADAAPDVVLRMDRASFVVLAGGRRDPDPGNVALEGDEALGRRLLTSMATVP